MIYRTQTGWLPQLLAAQAVRSPGASCTMIGMMPSHAVRWFSYLWRASMPAFNWFYAISLMMLLCAAAILLPFLLGGSPA